MKMRLLVDGDGTGDDRRLNMLLKTLIKWCNTEEDQQTCELTYQRMLTQLANIEWNMTKSRMAAAMNTAELENYSAVHQRVEQGIVSAKAEIEETKAELVEAKRIRKNRMEYDALAKVIMTHPDRCTSETRLETVKAELKMLQEKEIRFDEKLGVRKNDFHVLIDSIHQLQDLVNADEELTDLKTEDISKDSNLMISEDSDADIAD